MHIRLKKSDIKFYMGFLIFFFSLLLCYKEYIVPMYEYAGFYYRELSLLRIVISLVTFIIAIYFSLNLENDFFSFTSIFYNILIFIPNLIYYLCTEMTYLVVVVHLLPILFIRILALSKPRIFSKQRKINLFPANVLIICIIISMVMLFYYSKLNTIRISNLWLDDVYDVREAYQSEASGIIAYLNAPLCKVIFPILYIWAIDNKKKIVSLISILNILIIYLTTGAQKDIIVGIALIFYIYLLSKKNDCKRVSYIFLKTISLTLIVNNIICYIFNTSFLLTYIRRIFFVAPNLNEIYFNYFKNNYTFYSQMKFVSFLTGNPRFMVTRWVGENLTSKPTNANIGIFTEGYISFGLIGAIVAAIIFVFLCYYIYKCNAEVKYYGIWVAMIYLLNFSLFETALLTHALFFYLLALKYLVPSKNET